MNRRGKFFAALTAAATLVTAVGITTLALEPHPVSPHADSAPASQGTAAADALAPGSTRAASRQAEEPPQAVDRSLEKAVLAADAPAQGVPAVYYADDATLDDADFQAVAAGLTRIDRNVYTGNLTADQVPGLNDIDGLKVSSDAPLSIDPPVVPSDNAYDILWDTAVTVDDVSPGLVQARTDLGINGTGQVIAIVDSGVDSKALGLSGKVTYRKNFSTATSKCKDSGYYDPYGHGTHVASIAAGAPSGGIEGVAPGAKLVDLRVFNCAGAANTSNILAALNWVLANHVKYHIGIVNLSLESDDDAQDGQDATSILVNKLVASGIFVSVAAGNSGDLPNTVHSPGTAKYATTVGAANVSKYGAFLAPFSSRGAKVDLLAPGTSITAARSTKLGKTTKTIVYSGTSMAAPYVAGLAALALQQDPSRAPSATVCGACVDGVSGAVNGVQDALATTDWFTAGADEASGLGLVDAAATLTATAAAPASSVHLDSVGASDRPLWVEVPASSAPVTLSAVLDAGTNPGLGDENFSYGWYDATGDSSVVALPCSLTSSTTCSLPNLVDSRVFYFYRPASAVSTWLRLGYSSSALHLGLTAHGLAAPLTVSNAFATGGVVDLTTLTSASTTVTRRVAAASATTIDLVPSPGILVSAPSISVGQSVGNTAAFTVSIDSALVDPPSSARVALQVGGELVGVVTVNLPRSAAHPTMPVLPSGAQQGYEGYTDLDNAWDDWGQLVSGTGTVFGNSYQPGIARIAGGTPASGSFSFEPDGIALQPDLDSFIQPNLTTEVGILDVSQDATSSSGKAVYFAQADLDGGESRISSTNPVVPRDDTAWGWAFVKTMGTNNVKLLGGPVNNYLGYVYPTYYVNPFFWGQPKLSGDSAYVAYAAQYVSGNSVKQGIYWESTTGTALPKKVANGFNATIIDDKGTFGTRLRVVGTTATHVLVEYWGKGKTSSELRLYSVSSGKYTKLASVQDGNATLSVNGTGIGYVKSGTSTLYCYNTATKKTVSFGSHGTPVTGILATGDSCSYLVAAFRGTAALPPGSLASQLIRLNYGAAQQVLAESAPDWNSYRWFADRTGTKFATSTGASLSDGDTNGRVDLYPGAWGTSSLTGTGTLSVVGVTGVGETLTATGDFAWNGADEQGYQWYRGSTPIAGATGATYKPTTSDAGKTISVASVGTKLGSTPSLHYSNAVGPVTKAMKPGTPTISGTSEVGHTLTGSSGTWSPTGLTRHYQWNRDGVPISGATARTYKLIAADAGASITFSSTATRSGYTPTTRTSSARVIKLLLSTSTPTISGLGRTGEVLTLDAGTWGPDPVTLSYQWKRNGVSISKATGTTYKLTSSDAGKTITVSVKGVKTGYSTASTTSAGLAVEKLFSKSPSPKITGTGAVGKTLTTSLGTWSPTGATFSYQWLRNGAEIDGATAKTYVVVSDDAATKLSVRIVAAKTGYTPVTRTSATKTIALELTDTPVPLVQVGGVDPGGSALIGAKLQSVAGAWGPAPVKLTYQWKRNGVSISGATHSYHTVTTSDWNKNITVTVTGTKTGYGTISMTSAPVLALKKITTTGTPAVTVDGTPISSPPPASLTDGQIVAVSPGTWSSGVTFTYEWLDQGVAPIPGETGDTYTVDNSQLTPGAAFYVKVTGSRPGYLPVSKLVWLILGPTA
jgi:subtilisin family serine protease